MTTSGLEAAASALLGERLLGISGSFAPGTFAVEHFGGSESLGNPFSYEVVLISPSSDFDISSLVGDTVTVTVALGDGNTRYFNGYVTRMTLVDIFDTYARYQIRVEPWLYMLSSRINSRIFQNKSIPDIAKELFRDHGFSDFEDQLSASYATREYVVQYRESDFAFVSRILAHAGIYYYFRHEESRHVLVLADAASAHAAVPDYAKVEFHPQGTPTAEADEFINRWEVVHQWRSGAYASDDFDFERPKADLTAQLQVNAKHKKGDLEIFDYPAGYVQQPDVEGYVRTRLQNVQSDVEVASGSGDVRGVGAGNLFTLTGFPSDKQNKQYLIVVGSYDSMNSSHDTGGSQQTEYFHFSFSAIDSTVPFSPPLPATRPRVEGPQTAIVVGESGDEITTDKYGRIKVQFRWDREGKSDENSSCWVRVAQLWAGSGWGGIHIPRIGQEVIVDFLEGDPDRPIITGRVYNADNMPPYDLPANKTQSGIKSRSSKGGAPSNFNEIRFEDKKGSEELHIQAEKDETKLVKNNQTASIGVDRSLSVGSNETVSIGKNRTEKVGVDESVTIGSNQTISVGANQSLSVGANRSKSVSANETVTIGANSSETVGAGQTVSIGTVLSVTVGAAMTEAVGAAKTSTVGAALAVTVGAISSETVGGNKSLSAGGSISESAGGDVSVNAGGNAGISAGKNFGASSGADFSANSGAKMAIQATDELTLTCGSATIVMKSNGDITINGNKIQVEASSDMALKGSKITEN